MPGPDIAIATSKAPRQLDGGERLLIEALSQAGAAATSAIWSSPEVNWAQFSAVVVRSCWDYHLRVQQFLEWIKSLEDRNIPVINHPKLIRSNADKTYLKQFAAQGIPIPQTVWLQAGTKADVSEICAAHLWREAVVKPVVSASAYGTARRNSGPAHGPLMIQQYLPAIATAGEWSLMYFDHQFSHAVRKRPHPLDFRVQKDFGGSVEPATPRPNLTAFAQAVLGALPHPGTFARVDLVEPGAQIYLMEIEAIEPELFLNYAPGSAQLLARSILKAME